ncbi:MAG: response regulator [Rhizobiales bacterium]|nr:response regulator [Hyphomicrobiales bacterium]
MSLSEKMDVLVVEDDFLIAQEIADELHAMGIDKVQLAASVSQGERCLRKNKFAFAILDVNLGSDLVFPLAEKLSRKEIPFIFCTAAAARDMPAKWARFPTLHKPFDRESLAELMPTLFARSAGAAPNIAEPRAGLGRWPAAIFRSG